VSHRRTVLHRNKKNCASAPFHLTGAKQFPASSWDAIKVYLNVNSNLNIWIMDARVHVEANNCLHLCILKNLFYQKLLFVQFFLPGFSLFRFYFIYVYKGGSFLKYAKIVWTYMLKRCSTSFQTTLILLKFWGLPPAHRHQKFEKMA
jgi:hypothetical protein